MITNYLCKKLNCENYGIAVVVLIFSTIISGVISLVTPQEFHWIGIILSILIGIFCGVMIMAETGNDGMFVLISMPLLTTAIYEISMGIYYPLWIFIIIIAVMTEILFLLDKTVPNTEDKDHIMWFTTGRKIEAFVEAIVIFMLAKCIGRELNTLDYHKLYPIIVEDLKYIGLLVGAMIIIYSFVWINSWKYRK